MHMLSSKKSVRPKNALASLIKTAADLQISTGAGLLLLRAGAGLFLLALYCLCLGLCF